MSTSSLKDMIADSHLKASSREEYTGTSKINDVILSPARHFVTQDGSFSEVIRLQENGQPEIENFPSFKIRQINRSIIIPSTIKAWHFHLEQDEIWFPNPDTGPVIIGLLDIRKGSDTEGVSMRLSYGAGKTGLIYIPRGIAHGIFNPSQTNAELLYLVSNQFTGDDEHRLPHTHHVGDEFWTVQPG